MKKLLLATTLIVATATVAAAEVAVSGSARMGIVNDGTDTQFSSRVRIAFAGSGTTDGGLTFGAGIRADQSGQGGKANGDSTVFISGAFGTLTMGDVAGGGADNLVGQVSGVGFTGLGDNNEIGFIGGAATAVRYDYSMGALSVSVGIGQLQTKAAPAAATDDARSVGVKYAAGNYSVALGFSAAGSGAFSNSQVDLKATATFGAATVKARIAQKDKVAVGQDDMAYAVSLDYVVGAATVTGFVGNNTNFAGKDTSGLGVSYDLGGGAAFSAGYADNGAASNSGVYEAGITLKF